MELDQVCAFDEERPQCLGINPVAAIEVARAEQSGVHMSSEEHLDQRERLA